jgi:ankyrin repeat protein
VPTSLPDSPNLDFEKKHAKDLLAAWQAGDPAALARVQAHAPHFITADSAPKLAGAQFVVARERGFESWPKLKAHIDAAQPVERQAARFLAAIGDKALAVARRLLAEHPAIPSTSIHAAAAAADADEVARFLAKDRTLATVPGGRGGWPPLAYACWSTFHTVSPSHAAASLRVVEQLVAAGAGVNTWVPVPEGVDGGMLSVLYFACESSNVAVVRWLLEHGADPNDGESVYHAAQHGHLECLDLLLAHRADISNRHPHWNNTPLFFLAGHTDDQNGEAPWLRGFRWLLEHGADPNVTSYEARETPLHKLVASSRAAAATALLLEHGADVNAARADGRTPYVLALRAGNERAMSLLRGRGARTDVVTPIDALLGACVRGDRPEARRLAEAQPGWRSSLTGEDRGAVVQAAWADSSEAIGLMAELGFDPTWEGEWGGTPLHHAAWLGKPVLVRFLIALGAPVNVRDGRFGSSPIAWAAHGSTNCRTADDDYIAVVDLLLDAGATWEAAINKENEPPSAFASRGVARRFKTRGFGP